LVITQPWPGKNFVHRASPESTTLQKCKHHVWNAILALYSQNQEDQIASIVPLEKRL
jgi:hypothetical protein